MYHNKCKHSCCSLINNYYYSFKIFPLACVAGVKRVRGQRGREKEGEWGDRVRDACYKDPPLFLAADAGVRKFLIG